MYERVGGAAAPSWRLGSALGVFIPLVGVPTVLLTRLVAWLFEPRLFEGTLPTISKTAAFAPASLVFTTGMTLVAAAIVLAWPIAHAFNARAIARLAPGGHRTCAALNGIALAAGITAGISLAALAIITLEVNDPAHMHLSKVFFGAQVLALLCDVALALRLDARARAAAAAPATLSLEARKLVCLAAAASALVFLVLFLIKDAEGLPHPTLVRWLYVGSESLLCALLLCYSLTYVRDLRQAGASSEAADARFANELRTEWAVALLYRPVSRAVTPVLAACGIAPLAPTLLGAACAAALPIVALSGGAAWAVGLLAIACCVLDCIDGDLARATGSVSRSGAYADFAVDLFYRCALYAAVGVLADAGNAPGLGVATALASALLALLARAGRLYADAARPEQDRAAPGRLFSFLSGLDHLLPVAVIVLGSAGALPWLLAYLLAYSAGDLALTQRSVLARLR